MPERYLDHKDFAGNQALNLVLQRLPGDHASPETAMVGFNEAQSRGWMYDGTSIRYFAFTDELSGGGGDADTLDGQDSVYFLSRSNHTGQQTASTISDFESAVAALTGAFATDQDVENRIASLIDGAPAALDTLREIADALAADDFAMAELMALVGERAKVYSEVIGDGSATEHTVNHGLNTRKLEVQSWLTSAPYGRVWPTVELTTLNALTVRTRVAVAPDGMEIVVMGRQG